MRRPRGINKGHRALQPCMRSVSTLRGIHGTVLMYGKGLLVELHVCLVVALSICIRSGRIAISVRYLMDTGPVRSLQLRLSATEHSAKVFVPVAVRTADQPLPISGRSAKSHEPVFVGP
jgi:hypothetical protein